MTDPIYLRFIEQKKHARQRGISWELPYWEWLQIWQDSEHLNERGPHRQCWVMARNGDAGPYAAWNVKIIYSDTNNSANALARHAASKNRPCPAGCRSAPGSRR